MTIPVIPVLPPSVNDEPIYDDKKSLKLTTDTSSTLNESSDGAHT